MLIISCLNRCNQYLICAAQMLPVNLLMETKMTPGIKVVPNKNVFPPKPDTWLFLGLDNLVWSSSGKAAPKCHERISNNMMLFFWNVLVQIQMSQDRRLPKISTFVSSVRKTNSGRGFFFFFLLAVMLALQLKNVFFFYSLSFAKL